MQTVEEYKKLFDNLALSVGVMHKDGSAIYTNKKFASVLGYSIDEVSTLEDWFMRAFPDEAYREVVIKTYEIDIQNCFKFQDPVEPRLYETTCKDGTTKKLEFSLSVNGDHIIVYINDVSKIQNLIKELEEEKKFNVNLIENFPGVVFLYNKDLKLQRWNRTFRDLIGMDETELIGRSLFEERTNEVIEILKDAANTVNEEGQITIEMNFLDDNSKDIPMFFKVFKTNYKHEDYFIGIGINISERVNIENSLKERNKFIEDILNTAPINTWIFDLSSGYFKYFNKSGLESIGYSAEEIIKKPMLEFAREALHPVDLPKFLDNAAKLINRIEDTPVSVVYRIKDTRDNYHHYQFWDKVFKRKPNGDVDQVVGVAIDITERMLAEQGLINQMGFNNRIIDSIPGVFFAYKKNRDSIQLLKWNNNFETITGYGKEELESQVASDFYIEVNLNSKDDTTQNLPPGDEVSFEGNLKVKDGSKIPFFFNSVSYQTADGVFTIITGIDLTEKRKIALELKASEELFKHIFHNTSDGITIIDKELNILNANNTFLEMFGGQKSDLKNIQIVDYIIKSKHDVDITGRFNNPIGTRFQTNEYIMKNRKGEKRHVETRSRLITYSGTKAILTSVNDISERKKLQKEIYLSAINAEENERERIARELHDGMGPLLSTCRIYIYNIKNSDDGKLDMESIKMLEQLINDSLESVKTISNNLSPHILRNFGIFQAIKAFIEKLKTNCELILDIGCDIDTRFPEEIELTIYRVITELVNNSLKYAEANEIRISLNEEAKKITAEFSDDGKGFDFVTTIKENKGFGLLNIHSRINNLGGSIDYKSSPGNGVSVKIIL